MLNFPGGPAQWFYCLAAWFDEKREACLNLGNDLDIEAGILPRDFHQPKRHQCEWDWPKR